MSFLLLFTFFISSLLEAYALQTTSINVPSYGTIRSLTSVSKPNHMVLAQITSYDISKENAHKLLQDIGADGAVIVIGNEKHVATNRDFLKYFHDLGYYVILMAEIMGGESEYGRGNPNLWHHPSAIPEIPAQYRVAGYPNGYVSVHPEEALHQYKRYTIKPTTSVFDFKLEFDNSWGQGVSTWDIGFGPNRIYDGRLYNHVWDRSAGDADIPYGAPLGAGTTWEYVKNVTGDYVRLHNAVVGHEYLAWIMDRSVSSLVPYTREGKDAYLNYLRFLLDSYGDVIDGFYSTSSAFPREGIVNPHIQDLQNQLFSAIEGGFDLHKIARNLPWHEWKSYNTWVGSGTPNLNAYSWYRTVRDVLKEFYTELINLSHSYGVAFGFSSSDQNQWAFTMANEVGADFADKWANSLDAAGDVYELPPNIETVSIMSYCVDYQNQGITEWGNKIYTLLDNWRFLFRGSILWWLSTIEDRYNPTPSQRQEMKQTSDKFRQAWATKRVQIPELTVAIIGRGGGTGNMAWAPVFNGAHRGEFAKLPIKWLDVGEFPLVYELGGIPSEAKAAYLYLLEDINHSSLAPILRTWVLEGRGIISLGSLNGVNSTFFHLSPYDDYGDKNTEFSINETLRGRYSQELGLELPNVIYMSQAVRGLRIDGAYSLEGITLLYVAHLNPRQGVHLLSVQTNNPGRIAYFSIESLTYFKDQDLAQSLFYKLLYWISKM